ncbi:hypothetical protein CDD83_1554 [Cordyceps sp. RAO-2017]|nr:hypothetical protein CDD83_1554 [Cordyceps sp. RAO-2017]
MTPQTPRPQSVTPRSPPPNTRRSSTRSSASSLLSSPSCCDSPPTGSASTSFFSAASVTESTINGIICRQPSIRGLEEERRSFARGLTMLEPRPIVYWSSMEERMASSPAP